MDIALFPIPNCVTFPGQTVSLHVFEPRYRQMVEDCAADGRPLAVCGVKRLLEKSREMPVTSKKILNTNLDTFEPAPVVSYGPLSIVERIKDGRLLIEVALQHRARINRYTQWEPYYIAQVSPVDDVTTEPSVHTTLLRAEIGARFEALWNSVRKDEAPLPVSFDTLSFNQLSYQVLGFLQTDPVLAQLLLEETNPEKRASVVLDILCSLETKTTG